MSDDIQKETERIHQGIVESLSFSEALAKRDAEIKRLRQLLGDSEQLQAEIERLREFVKFLNSFRPDAELAKRDAEIERLRLEVLFRDTEVRAKADEIDRLRGLLREILGKNRCRDMWLWNEDLHRRVREALGDDC